MVKSARMNPAADGQDEIHQHSGWLIPLGVLITVALLSGLFLLYDLRPGLKSRDGARSADAAPVDLSVRGLSLRIPANYLDNPRQSGARDTLALSALLPNLSGYTPADAALFDDNAPNSPVVHLLLKTDDSNLDAAGRLERIYMPYISDPTGSAGDFGLTRYAFKSDSGYGSEDLFTGGADTQTVLLLCERASADLPSPNCLAIGRPVARNVSFSYRFKRAYLAQWSEIAPRVDGLLARFQSR